jgi:hypothetical protein
MAHLICPRCQRANPDNAIYCWFDGVVLNQAAASAALSPSQLPLEFAFPSGRRCRTYDDLVEGCHADWEDARDLLHKGDFGRYLARIGRMDLVRAAQEAQAQADPDIALQNFLSSLPGSQVQGLGPRLDLSPRRLMLGTMRVGGQRQAHVTVSNKGKGLLQGKIRVTEGEDWLKIEGVDGERELPLKTTRDQEVTLRVEPRGLPAGQTYSGKLTVVTNGGVAEAPVRLDLEAAPFAKPPFQGAASARELAERMRANPKPAGPLLESGEVARWFAANGWSYPVAGTPARGVAAVQQFFECMGLSKPPALELSQSEFRLQCDAPETVRGQLTLRTPARKWVYAQATGDQPWLRVTTPNVSGPQQTAISFEADSTLMGDGEVQEGLLQISANAGQRFLVRVRVEVRRPRGYRPPPAPAPVAPSKRASVLKPPPAPIRLEPVANLAPRRYGGRLVRAAAIGAVLALLLRAVLFLPADLYARIMARAMEAPTATVARAPTASWNFWQIGPMTEAAGDKPAVLDPGFLRQFVWATWWLGGVAGLILVWRHGGRWTDVACGAAAGAAAGVAGAATLGCGMVFLDGLPRLLLAMMGAASGSSLSPWAATPLWFILAVGCWALLGAGAGFLLGAFGARGMRILTAAAAPLAWVMRMGGGSWMATFLSLQ